MVPIPAIDIKGGQCVRLSQGQMESAVVYATDPLAMAHRWVDEGAQRLHLVDLEGAISGMPIHADLIETLLRDVGVAVQVGGGIRQIDTIERYLSAGARWVILGTSALQNGSFVAEAVRQFPGRIIVGIDLKRGKIATRGWTQMHSENPTTLAMRMEQVGVSALILTDVEKDGMLAGPNFDLYQNIAGQVQLPLIASGGITTPAHIQQLAHITGIEGVVLGKALYTGALAFSDALLAASDRSFETPC